MSEMLEQLKLSKGALGQDGGAEWFHDLFDCDRLSGQLVSRRAV